MHWVTIILHAKLHKQHADDLVVRADLGEGGGGAVGVVAHAPFCKH